MSSCKVNSAALEACVEGYNAFLEVIKSREKERMRRDRLLFIWSEMHAQWVRDHNEQKRRLEAGRGATSSEIWHNGVKYNCKTGKPV